MDGIYPKKPMLVEKKSEANWGKTFLSIALFVLTFSFLFPQNWGSILLLVLVLIIHELGHFSAMKLLRYTEVKMLFIPLLGAFVHGKKELYSQREKALVLLAGPVPGIIIGALLMYWAGEREDFWMMYTGLLFSILNVLNLLPILPLDGGQLVKVLFFEKQELFQLIFTFISSLIVIAMGWFLSNWMVMLFGFFLGWRVHGFQKMYRIHRDLRADGVNIEQYYAELSDMDYHHIKQVFLKHSHSASRIVEQGMIEETYLNELLSNEVNNILETPLKKDLRLGGKLLFLGIWLACFVLIAWSLTHESSHLAWFINEIQTGR